MDKRIGLRREDTVHGGIHRAGLFGQEDAVRQVARARGPVDQGLMRCELQLLLGAETACLARPEIGELDVGGGQEFKWSAVSTASAGAAVRLRIATALSPSARVRASGSAAAPVAESRSAVARTARPNRRSGFSDDHAAQRAWKTRWRLKNGRTLSCIRTETPLVWSPA